MKKSLFLLITGLLISNLLATADTGWYQDFVFMSVDNTGSESYWIGDDPGSGTKFDAHHFGTVGSLEIKGCDMKYSNPDNCTGGAIYFKILNADGSGVSTENIWNQTNEGGDEYRGSLSCNINLLEGLLPGTTYQLHIWARCWSTNGDSWLSNEGNNYIATFTTQAAPAMFKVTGGGYFCAGETSLVVGLDNSEEGVLYTLLKDAVAITKEIEGTGSPLNFGPQPEGVYTITATRAAFVTAMNGNAVIVANERPTAAINSSNKNACSGSNTLITGHVTATGNWVLTLSPGGDTVSGNGNASWSKAVQPVETTSYTISSLVDEVCQADAAGLIGTVTISVTTNSWAGGTTGNWEEAENWCGGMPGAATNVEIPQNTTIYITSDAESFAVCNDLTINGVLIIDAGKSLTVKGKLTNNAGAAGLIIRSDAEGSGSLIENSGIEGTFESYIPNNEFHLISSPVSAERSGLFLGKYLQNFDETSNSYQYITETDVPLIPAKGYVVWAMGNEGTGFTATYSKGKLNSGNFSLNNLSRTQEDDLSNSGWNLVGNPYPSYLSWDNVSKNGLFDAIYTENAGEWATYVNGVGIPAGFTGNIAPGQGFMVQVATGNSSGSAYLTNKDRVHQTGSSNNSGMNDNIIRLKAVGNNYEDETVVRFADDATSGFDGYYDAHKLFSRTPGRLQIYTKTNIPLAINTLPTGSSKVALGIRAKEAGTYTITNIGISGLQQVALEDTKTGIFTDLNQNSYSFSYEPGESDMRFVLHFGTTAVAENETESNIQIYSELQTVYVNMNETIKGDIYIFNSAGQLVAVKKSASGNMSLKMAASGVFIVKVVTNEKIFVGKVQIN